MNTKMTCYRVTAKEAVEDVSTLHILECKHCADNIKEALREDCDVILNIVSETEDGRTATDHHIIGICKDK